MSASGYISHELLAILRDDSNFYASLQLNIWTDREFIYEDSPN